MESSFPSVRELKKAANAIAVKNPRIASNLLELAEKAEKLLYAAEEGLRWEHLIKNEKSLDSNWLASICRDFGVDQEEYSSLSAPSAGQIKMFEEFIGEAREEAKVLLQELPDESRFRAIRLHQDLVRRHFQLDKFISDPQRAEGPFFAALAELRQVWQETFLNECRRERENRKMLQKEEKEIQKKIRALEALRTSSGLVEEGVVETFSAEFAGLEKNLPRCNFEPGSLECRRSISQRCEMADFPTDFEEQFKELYNKVEKALEKALGKLRRQSVEHSLARQGGDELTQFLELLQISEIGRLVDLLATPEGEKIIEKLSSFFQKK
jgi:hypothetical protein